MRPNGTWCGNSTEVSDRVKVGGLLLDHEVAARDAKRRSSRLSKLRLRKSAVDKSPQPVCPACGSAWRSRRACCRIHSDSQPPPIPAAVCHRDEIAGLGGVGVRRQWPANASDCSVGATNTPSTRADSRVLAFSMRIVASPGLSVQLSPLCCSTAAPLHSHRAGQHDGKHCADMLTSRIRCARLKFKHLGGEALAGYVDKSLPDDGNHPCVETARPAPSVRAKTRERRPHTAAGLLVAARWDA